jgi:hypothetical protein
LGFYGCFGHRTWVSRKLRYRVGRTPAFPTTPGKPTGGVPYTVA